MSSSRILWARFRTARSLACRRRHVRRPRLSPTEAAVACLIGTDRAQEVDLAKSRPQDICKVELTVYALPEQETGQADFAAGSDDQVGIGQVRRIKMASDGLGCDALNHVRQQGSLLRLRSEQGTDSVGDLLAPSVRHCNRQCHQIV